MWPYYVREALGEGPPYDGLLGELTTGTSHNEQEATEVRQISGLRIEFYIHKSLCSAHLNLTFVCVF